MMSKKGLVAGIFSAALVLSLGITPGVAADISEPVENARAEGSINSVSSDDNKQRTEIPQDWVPVDTEQAREALQNDFDSNGGAWVLPMDLVNSYGTVILWARM